MGKKTNITLEEYEIFLENPFMSNFSNNQINQVIFMHGFNRMWRRPKIELLNAVSTIDLLRPFRSSLEDDDYVDGGEFCRWLGAFVPSTEEVKRDLEIINWQECQVHAVENVGLALAAAENSSGARRNSRRSGGAAVSLPPKDLLASPLVRRKQRSRKRKRRFLDSINGGVFSVGGEGSYGGQEEGEGTDIPSAAVAEGAEAAAGSASLYVDTYHWEL